MSLTHFRATVNQDDGQSYAIEGLATREHIEKWSILRGDTERLAEYASYLIRQCGFRAGQPVFVLRN